MSYMDTKMRGRAEVPSLLVSKTTTVETREIHYLCQPCNPMILSEKRWRGISPLPTGNLGSPGQLDLVNWYS